MNMAVEKNIYRARSSLLLLQIVLQKFVHQQNKLLDLYTSCVFIYEALRTREIQVRL